MLDEFLTTNIYAFMLIFARIGAVISVMPGLGEAFITTRVKLLFALLFTYILLPLVGDSFAVVPTEPFHLLVNVLREFFIGIFIGMSARLIISTMHIAGMIISYQAGLSAANMFDPSQGTQGSVIGNFLSLMALLAFFAMDLHHLMIMGMKESYAVFANMSPLIYEDISQTIIRIVGDSFLMAVKISAPHIVIGVMIYATAGVMARLMPNMQVFFVLIPPQILLGFVLLLVSFTSIMYQYISYMENNLMLWLVK